MLKYGPLLGWKPCITDMCYPFRTETCGSKY